MKKIFTLIAMALMAMSASATSEDLSLEDLGSGWSSSYDAATKTITYESAWSGRGWWLGGKDCSAFKQAVVEFEQQELGVTLCVQYFSEGTESIDEALNSTTAVDAGVTKVAVSLSDADKGRVAQIYIQCHNAGTVVLKSAFLTDAEGDAQPEQPTYEDGVLWEGSILVNGWADQPFLLSDGGKELKAAGAEAGDYLYFYASAPDDTWQVQLVEGHWGPKYQVYSALPLTDEAGNPMESTIVDLAAQGYFSFQLTEDVLTTAYTAGGWGGTFLLNGDGNLTVTKVQLVKAADVPSQETVTRIVWAEEQVGDAATEYKNGDFVLSVTDTDGKIKIDANDAYFGTADAYEQFSYRLKSGGKSSSKNALQLTIPADGTLKVYARTGSNSAEDRNLVLTQDGTELYNQIVKEADAALVTIGEKEKNVYPVVSVAVKAGTVDVTYPVGSMNFYGFEMVTVGGTADAIESVEKTVVSDGAVYNLRGQRVDASYKGLVIRNGKKFFQK